MGFKQVLLRISICKKTRNYNTYCLYILILKYEKNIFKKMMTKSQKTENVEIGVLYFLISFLFIFHRSTIAELSSSSHPTDQRTQFFPHLAAIVLTVPCS